MLKAKSVSRIVFFAGLIFLCGFANAQGASDPAAEMKAAFADAQSAAVRGPQSITVRNQASLSLPAGFVFVPEPQAERLLKAMGNQAGKTLVGMIFPASNDSNWMAVVNFIDAGYIKDDEAKTWNADELLKNLKEGTEQQNEQRRSRGIPEIEVAGWVQPPSYDMAMHRLVWSAATKDKGEPGTTPRGVNYNTYALGRQGYISLNLVTD